MHKYKHGAECPSNMNVTLSFFLQLSGEPQLNQEMLVKVEFTNIFSFPLRGINLSLEGAGLIAAKTKYYR